MGVHVVKVGQDLGCEQDAQRGANGATAEDQVTRRDGRRDRRTTKRGIGGAKRDEAGHDQDHAGEVEGPRPHQASDQADDRDGGPGPAGKLRPLVERRPGWPSRSLLLSRDRGVERGVVERRFGLDGHG